MIGTTPPHPPTPPHSSPLPPWTRRAQTLAVAGLLHDIGKILEPAGVELDGETLAMERTVCPTDRISGRPTHRHALYTAQALASARTNYGGLDRDEIFRIASHHHRPADGAFDEHLLTKADRLASGHDRRRDATGGEPVTGLASVFARLEGRGDGAGQQTQIPTGPLAFGEDAFLPRPSQSPEEYRDRCAALVEAALRPLGRDYENPASCLAHLDASLQRVAHAVPGSRSRSEWPDVSLYDHSRVVAAFAACLGVLHESGPCDAEKIEGSYRICTYTLRGIQRFITRSIPAADSEGTGDRGRARGLRAKSFYVSLLSRLVGWRLLDDAGLPRTNLVIEAGGGATLLLPDHAPLIERVRDAAGILRRFFIETLAGTLRLDLAMTDPLCDADFLEQRFERTHRESMRALRRSALRGPALERRTTGVWDDEGWVGDTDGLPVDGEPFRRMLDDLGRKLPRAAALSIDTETPGLLSGAIETLGYRVQLHDTLEPDAAMIAIELPDDLAAPTLITANHIPRASEADVRALADLVGEMDEDDPWHRDRPLTFSHLAHLSTDDGGSAVAHPMLGVLRADVDRLGLLLAYGFGERASFGRFAAMSRSLDLFFKGFLTDRLHEDYPRVYTVFSGGDDLFLVGPWYDMVRLVRDLRRWFVRHACEHPRATISAGLVFTKPHTPVRELAESAAVALEAAKDGGRDRVTLCGATMTWDGLDRAWALHLLLLEASRAGVVPSLVYRLLCYGQSALRVEVAERTGDVCPMDELRWRAQLSYDLKRNLSPGGRDDGSPENRLRAEMAALRHGDGATLSTAAALTLYRMRGGWS